MLIQVRKRNDHDTYDTDIDDDRQKGKLKSLQTRSCCNVFFGRSITIVKLAFASTIVKLTPIASMSVNTALIKTIPTSEE